MLNIVLPARLESTRLPGKMLAMIGGQPLVRHAVLRVLEAQRLAGVVMRVVVATDSTVIAQAVDDLCPVQMTSADCRTGSDRVAEAAALQDWDRAEIVVNVQADMPFVDPEALAGFLQAAHAGGDWDVLTAQADLAVVRIQPYCQFEREQIASHIGLYAYTGAALARFAGLPSSVRERAASLEQLRAIDAGFHVRLHAWPGAMPFEVNTPADLAALQRLVGAVRQQGAAR